MMKNLLLSFKKIGLGLVLLLVMLTMSSIASGQTNTWDGSSNSSWNTAANWSLNLVPTAAHDVVIPDNATGANKNPTVNASAVCSTLTIDAGGNSRTLTISGTNTLTVSGAVTINNTTAATKIIAVGTGNFNCASISMSNTSTNNDDCRVTISTGTVTVSGNITMNGSAARNQVQFTGAGTLNIGGNISGGDIIPSSGTINYNGTTSSQTVAINADYVYNNLHINNTNVSGAILGSAITTSNVTGNIRVQTGILDNNGFTIVGSSGDTFEVSNGATLLLKGTSTMPTGFGTITLGNTSAVNYAGANQSIAARTYGNIILSGSGTKTAGGSISVNGSTTLDGVTLSSGVSSGNSSSLGIFSLNSNSMIALGTGNHTLTFDDSSAATWDGTSLTITGWTGSAGSSGTSGKIFFGATTGTLTAAQLGKINFTGYSGTPILLSTGELVPSGAASSSPTDFFRTKTTGNWGSVSTWESSFDGNSWIDATLTPTDEASSIVIRTGHSVSVNVDVSIDQTQVENGATLKVNTAQTLTLNNGSGADLTVDGSLIVNGIWINSGTTAGSGVFTFNNGANYQHAQDGGTIPTATWAASSTCLVTGITATGPAGLNQTFGNLTWNCAAQTGNTAPAGDITIQGDFVLSNGSFTLSNGPARNMFIGGNYTQTNGLFDFNIGTSGTFLTKMYVAGNFLNTASTDESMSTVGNGRYNGEIIFNGSGTQTLSFTNPSAARWISYTIESTSTVQLLSNFQLYGDNGDPQYYANFTVNGTFDAGTFSITDGVSQANATAIVVNSGAHLITANSGGISGTFPSATTTKTLSSGANYEFQGANTGTFLTTPDAGTVNDLIVNRSGGVTLSQSIAVGGNLIFTSGLLNSTTSNLLSVTSTSSSAISGASSTSFVNGPLRWTLPASWPSGSIYNFPVGEGTAYLPFTLENPTTGTGTTTAQVEAFSANSGGSIDATLDSKSSSEYWSLTTSGNFTNSSLSVDKGSAISPYDIIAGATSQSGTYTSLEGTAGATGVSNSDLIGSNRFFVLAEKKKNTITTGTISGSPFCQGATFSVPFTISGTYNSGNIFTAQLSDASGSFSSPVAIGSLTSTGAGTISATIPSGASGGTGYRIRVVSSNPSVTGSDNGSNIAINVIPSAPLVGTIVQPTCDVATGSVTLNGLPSGNWTVTMNPGGVKTTGTGSSTTITNLAPGTYSFTVTGEDESIACPGSGNGLKGEYFNVMDLSGTPVLTRTDATVNFNWGTGTPGSPVNVNVFSVRWSGKVQACYTENYTFTTRSDDGIRLSVNGNQIINNWTDHSATDNSGNIPLVAGQKYDIVLEFYENGGDAVSQLSWSSPSQPTSVIIPQSQLYSEATGCTSVASANVVINAQPAVPAAPISVTPSTATSVCLGESFNLNATSAGNTIYWFTQASGGTTIGSSNSGENFSVSPSVNTTYYAEAQSSSGCISATRTATSLITVTSTLSAVALAPVSQQNICIDGSGSQITVTETNGGTISSRQWGKRSVSGGAITNIAGATGSTYTPTGADLGVGTWFLVCTSTPTCGSAMSSNEIIVVVAESIGGTVSGGVTPACLGTSIGTLTLTGYTGTIKNWEKRVDGGSWSYITNTSATYSETPSSAGTWQYRAVVQNGSCNVANSSEITIVVDPVSVGGGVYDGTTPICLNSSTGTMNLRAGYVGNVVRWEKRVDGGAWSNIANTSTAYSENPSVPGTWEYRALVQSGSCTAVYSTAFSVVVNPELTITLGANPSVCQTTTATTIPYSATTGNPADWVLTFNAAAISAGFTSPQNGSLASSPGNIPVYVPYNVAAGVYQANLKLIKYTPSCSSVDYPVTITVSASQSVSVTIAASSNPVCSGSAITYTATPVNGGDTPEFQWKVNGNDVGTNSAVYSYTPIDNDMVTCVLTSSKTCASSNPATSNSVTMTVNAIPAVTNSTAKTICNGSSTNIALTATTASSYSWTIGTITGGIIGASAGSGSTIDQVLTNPSNSAAGSVQYIVTPTSISGSCVGSPFTITVTVQTINALVNDISDEIGSDCPDFGDFNPNTASYNPGYTVVKFRVERDLSSAAWSFDYTLSGGILYSGSPEVVSATKNVAAGSSSVDMVFFIANTPGAAQNIVFKVVNVSDSNCANNGINRTITHTILAMPAIGSFN